MSYTDHLSDSQFYKYKPAKEEGKAASDWLSTDEGMDWQLHHGHFTPSAANMFTIKPNVEDTLATASVEARWPVPHPWHDLDPKKGQY